MKIDINKIDMSADEFELLMRKMLKDKRVTLYVEILSSKNHFSTFQRAPIYNEYNRIGGTCLRDIGTVQLISGRGYLANPEDRTREFKFFESRDQARDYLLETCPHPIFLGCWSHNV